MRPTTTTALALAGTALALPAGVALAASEDPPSPTDTTLAAPFAGHLSMNGRMRAERREALVERYTPRVIRLERKTAHVKGVKFDQREHRNRLRGDSPGELRAEMRKSRRELRSAKRAAAGTAGAGANSTAPPHLEAIAACESGGNPSANTGNGFYGKYQFTASTWASVGGTGNPAAAPEAEQDRRAAMLYAQQGSSPWPVCGR
jgi:hypothetical protein